MNKINCWEDRKCGREQGGNNVDKLGVCPATLLNEYDGKNNGVHSGRFCWAIAGTLCNVAPTGMFACKLLNCLICDFFKKVKAEEGSNFIFEAEKIKTKKKATKKM